MTANRTFYTYFDAPANPFRLREKNISLGYLEGKEFIDFSCGKKYRYEGYCSPRNVLADNNHHIKTSHYYSTIIPKLNEVLDFGYDRNDFKLIPNYSADGKYNVSYLYPKDDSNTYTFFIEENVVKGKFSVLTDFDTNVCQGVTAYHKLYAGAHQCSAILNNGKNNGKSIIISGDSMMIPVVPILAYYYKLVVMMDNRNSKLHDRWLNNLIYDDCLIEFFDSDIYNNYKTELNFK